MFSCKSFNPTVNWLNWDQWAEKEALKDRKGLVWIHSPSCDDCIEMKEHTFTHPEIVRLINDNFHAIKLDIHHKERIQTKKRTWEVKKNKDGGEFHELAAALCGAHDKETVSYPTVTFLDENFDMITPIPQKLSAKDLELLLHFVKEEVYKKMSVEEFEKSFQPKIVE